MSLFLSSFLPPPPPIISQKLSRARTLGLSLRTVRNKCRSLRLWYFITEVQTSAAKGIKAGRLYGLHFIFLTLYMLSKKCRGQDVRTMACIKGPKTPLRSGPHSEANPPSPLPAFHQVFLQPRALSRTLPRGWEPLQCH